MKNILVPTDFSPESHHAFAVALHLAQRLGARLTLLHAIELPETANFSSFGGPVGGSELPNSSGGPSELYVLRLLQATKHRMLGLIAEAQQLAPEVEVHDLVQTSRFDEAVRRTLDSQPVDLIVMGAQGHSATEHFFYGSNTERLVRTAPCPVLAVKHAPESFDVQKLVFPSTFTREADQAVPELRRVQALFPAATLYLLKVVASPEQEPEALRDMAAFAKRHQLGRFEPSVVTAAHPSQGISAFAESINADLLLVPTHGRTGLSRFLQASIAEKVATHAFPPVLTFQLG